MSVLPFGKNRDPSLIFEISNKYHLHFNTETTLEIKEDVQDFYINLYDLTNIEYDFFVLVNDRGNVQGISGLLRSSYFSRVWFVMIAIIPESLDDPNISKLLDSVLDVTKEYLKTDSKGASQPVQLIVPSSFTYLQRILANKSITPIEYTVDLLLHLDKYEFQSSIPLGIAIRTQTTAEEIHEYVQISNEAFASHFNYEPVSIDHPSIQQSNYKAEQGELERIFAYAGDKMVGLIVLSTPKSSKTGMITFLAVKPEYQARGIGTALLHQGIKRLLEHSYTTIIIHGVFYSNNKALELYLRLGSSVIEDSKYVIYSLSEALI
ncbi:MAG: GNAT family N-acetyltransferase [Candidatus Hodarchaeota archaeon]